MLFLTVFLHRFSLFFTVSHCFSPFLTVSHRFSPFLSASHRFLWFLTVSHSFPLFLTVSHHGSMCCWPCWSGGLVGLVVGPWVWWACWSGGFCGVLTDKSPTLRGPTCQGVLGLVFHRFPGTSIRPHYMPVKRAECFPFRDFLVKSKVNFFCKKVNIVWEFDVSKYRFQNIAQQSAPVSEYTLNLTATYLL